MNLKTPTSFPLWKWRLTIGPEWGEHLSLRQWFSTWAMMYRETWIRQNQNLFTIFHRSKNVSAPQNNFVTQQISACLLVPATMLGILGTHVGKTALPSRTHLTLLRHSGWLAQPTKQAQPHLCCAVTCHLMVFRSTVDYGKEGSLLSYTNPS